MDRPESCDVKNNDNVICIKDSYPYKKDEKYKVKDIDDEYITIYCDDKGGFGIKYKDFPRIVKLRKVLKEYDECEHDDVKKVLDVTLPPIINLEYFEDIFITVREQRKRKLEQINEIRLESK